jgi:hypothetical protein
MLMIDRNQLIEELRFRIKDGASPSGLIRHILAVAGDQISYADLCGILQDAFCLPAVRISLSSVSAEHDHRGAILNKTLLMEILLHRSDWDTHPWADATWLDGLQLRTLKEIGKEVRAAPYPGLTDKNWSSLSPEEKEVLHAQLVSSIVISERMEVLSTLVERLQMRLDELEGISPVHPDKRS